MVDNIIDIIANVVSRENIIVNEPLKKHTTFKIGGDADFFVSPASGDEVALLIKTLKEQGINYYVLGNGSNVLTPDEGYSGVIIYVGENLSDIEIINDTIIKVQAGAMLSKTAHVALDNSLTGMEFAAGIPGSVGGAIVMNAGAYGGEIKDILVSATVCDTEGNIITIPMNELKLAYRYSIIEEKQYTVLSAVFKLQKGNKEDIKFTMSELAKKRREKQPLELPSAGSTFKRPEGYFAGKLIEDSGLRGYTVGGAQVSEKHCGFVVNKGDATSYDVKKLMQDVSDEVYKQFGVRIEPEIKIL